MTNELETPSSDFRFELNADALFWGFFWGLLLGGLAVLFLTPRSGQENRQQITTGGQQIRRQVEEAVTPTDPVAESIAEGKAAARRRRTELGLD